MSCWHGENVSYREYGSTGRCWDVPGEKSVFGLNIREIQALEPCRWTIGGVKRQENGSFRAEILDLVDYAADIHSTMVRIYRRNVRLVNQEPVIRGGKARLWAYSTAGLAKAAGCSESTVRRAIEARKLDPVDLLSVCAWLQQRRAESSAP